MSADSSLHAYTYTCFVCKSDIGFDCDMPELLLCQTCIKKVPSLSITTSSYYDHCQRHQNRKSPFEKEMEKGKTENVPNATALIADPTPTNATRTTNYGIYRILPEFAPNQPNWGGKRFEIKMPLAPEKFLRRRNFSQRFRNKGEPITARRILFASKND